MNHGVIVGPIVAASAERLVLSDGTEFAVSGLSVPANLAIGTIVRIVYQLVGGLRMAVSITLVEDRERPG